jgi:hypothetical protein
MRDSVQRSNQNDFIEKPKIKSSLKLITKVIVLDSLNSLWVNMKEVFFIFKFYLFYGLLPNKKQLAFDQQLLFSKRVLGIYLLLSVFKIVLLELSQSSLNASNFSQYIGELLIVILYYLGIIIFSLLGKLIAILCYRKYDKIEIESFMLGEFNFLFLVYYFLIFFGIINTATENVDSLPGSFEKKYFLFCLFIWFHSFYSYFFVFKQNKFFIRFKRTLIIFPILITVVMFFFLLILTVFDSSKFLKY